MARVLLVDEPSIRKTLGAFLEAEGHVVTTAANLEEAERHLGEATFDVVVSDIILPRANGLDLLPWVKRLDPQIEVVLITGDPNLQTAMRAMREGAFDYLPKPVTGMDICRVVAKAAEAKELKDNNRQLQDANRRHQKRLEELVESLTAIDANAVELRQVLHNLVTSAFQSLADGHGTIRVKADEIELGRQDLDDLVLGENLSPGRYITLEVSDTGIGIAPENLDRVFDPYFTTQDRGRGLGLTSVLGIAKSHGGALRIRSTAGEGTSVCLILPAATAASPAAASPSDIAETMPVRASEPPARQEGGTILIIEDEEQVLSALSRALATFGFTVLEARDGIEGVEVFDRDAEWIDLVLLDHTLPGLDGSEVLLRLRSRRREVPVLLTSAYGWNPGAERYDGPHEEFDDYLQKPFRLSELREKITDILAGREGPGK